MTDPSTNAAGHGPRPSPIARGRAVTLLERVLSTEGITLEALSQGLMVSTTTLSSYRTGSHPMPLEIQLLLVAFTLERSPEHGRLARRLRDQLKATITFAAGQTVTHLEPPLRTRW